MLNLIFEALFKFYHWGLSSASEEGRGERQGCCRDAKALGKSGKVNHKLQHLGMQVEEDSERNQLSSSSHLLRELSSVENAMMRLSADPVAPETLFQFPPSGFVCYILAFHILLAFSAKPEPSSS